MTVAEEIFERVKYLPIQVQRHILVILDDLKEFERTEDPDGLIAWTKSGSASSIAQWPRDDWSQEYEAWKAQQARKNEAG